MDVFAYGISHIKIEPSPYSQERVRLIMDDNTGHCSFSLYITPEEFELLKDAVAEADEFVDAMIRGAA